MSLVRCLFSSCVRSIIHSSVICLVIYFFPPSVIYLFISLVVFVVVVVVVRLLCLGFIYLFRYIISSLFI